MPQHFKVHELLSRDELDQLEAFARQPGRTVDECHEWMQTRGFTLSRSATGTWLQQFKITDRFAAAALGAKSVLENAKSGGMAAISDATTMQLTQMLFEQLLAMQTDDKVTTKELWAVSMALKNAVTGQRHIEKLKGEMKTALAEAGKEAGKGASADAVVNLIAQRMGIA